MTTTNNTLKLDEVDLDILLLMGKLQPNQTLTTTRIAKQIFNIQNITDLRKKTNFVRRRLENKLVEKGLVEVTQDQNTETNIFTLADSVSTTDNATLKTDKIELPVTNVIVIQINDHIRGNFTAETSDILLQRD